MLRFRPGGIGPFAFILGALSFAVGGCGDDGSDKVGPDRPSLRGEPCSTRNDCAEGLGCFGGTCLDESFDVAPSARSCVAIQCEESIDCCDLLGDCTGTRFYDCVENRCEVRNRFECLDAFDCFPFGLAACVDNVCEQCDGDEDCAPDFTCIENECIPNAGAGDCEFDVDCNLFEECQGGECVRVGCANDRECQAFFNDDRGACFTGEDTAVPTCIIPCENDAQCGNYFSACLDGRCQYLGCESDAECRVQCTVDRATCGFPPFQLIDIVCR